MSNRLPRRHFLLGAAATTVLAACSSGSGSGDGPTSADGTDVSLDPNDLSVVRFFGPYFAAGEMARIPFGLSDSAGLLPTEVLPGNVTLSVKNPDGDVVAEGLTAVLRTDGLPRPYYAFEFTPASPGFYDFTMDVEGSEVISQFQIIEPDAPEIADRVGPGDVMPALVTPTVADPLGVTPLCTREPACTLHDHTVADVVGNGPMALLVATPAFCQTVICGPVLDVMLDVVADYPDITFLHAEVYTDPSKNQVPPVIEDFAPVVRDLGLPYEPVFYVVGADGVVRDRLDYIFDASDMRSSLDDAVV
ncbi:hypothetical protein [Actinospongicola halichondriae]|uniref:hypothetical protein n=1 Tax=Actinospongicola halichondriae TaxID=3236844 RepID=UPI003D4E6B47